MPKTLLKNTLPQIGSEAPNFEAFDHYGKKITLKEYKDKIVVLYFYLKDNSPDCTKQACSLRDRFSTFKKKGIIILGVSKDSQKSHQDFIEKLDLPFTLISDIDKKLFKAYGALEEKIQYSQKFTNINKTTFVIDPNQKIVHIFNKVDCENHAEEILEKLEELGLI